MKAFYLAKSWWQLLVMAAVCYFVGCFNFAKFISRRKNKDITKMGSGNPGTMNMSREFGLKVGLLTFVCDALKGGVPALVSYFIYRNYYFAGTAFIVSDFTRYFCGLFIVLGHIFPVTARFKGGKGVASSLGLLWLSLSAENPWWIFIAFVALLLVVGFIAVTEWGSLGSFLGVTGLSIAQMVIFLLRYGFLEVNAYLVATYVFIFAINLLVWTAHRANIARLFSGEERRTSVKSSSKGKKNG